MTRSIDNEIKKARSVYQSKKDFVMNHSRSELGMFYDKIVGDCRRSEEQYHRLIDKANDDFERGW